MRKNTFLLALLFAILLIIVFTISLKYLLHHRYYNNANTALYYYFHGIAAYHKKDYPLFAEYLTKAVESAPYNPNLIYNLARAYALNGNKKDSLKLLNRCVELGFYFNSPDSSFDENESNDFKLIKDSVEFKTILKTIERTNIPINNSEIAFEVPEKDLMPESISYDPAEHLFYIGSAYKSKIISIDKKGYIRNLTDKEHDRLWSVWGIKVDTERRILWATSSPWYGTKGFKENDFGITGVFKYDLAKKTLIKKYILDERPLLHEFNDLVITSAGDVFITDDLFGAVYRISHKKNALELFLKPTLLTYPNGIALSQDEQLLYIAHRGGILVINLATKSYFPLSHPSNTSLCEIDGLYFYKNSLIAIQGTYRPPRVVRFFLNDTLLQVDSARIIESANPLFMLPTTGVIVEDIFYYIANSQLNCYTKENKIFALDKLHDIVILKTEL